MSDLIAIIVSILIGLGIKWVEGRNKEKKNSAPVAAEESSLRVGVPRRYQHQVTETPQPSQVSKPKQVEYKPMFEEGQCAVSHDEPAGLPADSDASDAELAAHYDRWRRAIIDAQIITPKFKEYIKNE